MALADASGESSIPILAPTKVHLVSPGPSADPHTRPPRPNPPHQHQPLPLTHPIGPRCACGITCHVPVLPCIPLDYPSQVLCRHSEPRPCHSDSLTDPPHPLPPPLMSRSHFSLLPPYHTVWPWPMSLGRALYPY